MWEEGVRIYGTPGVRNNFPFNIYIYIYIIKIWLFGAHFPQISKKKNHFWFSSNWFSQKHKSRGKIVELKNLFKYMSLPTPILFIVKITQTFKIRSHPDGYLFWPKILLYNRIYKGKKKGEELLKHVH